MHAHAPLISIVTPSYNQGAFLSACIGSVFSQDYPAVEHIVIDGGSTDASVPILMSATPPWPKILRFTSGRDGGQAAAVNTGFAAARGDILGWLNSDDAYAPGAFVRVADYFARHPEHVMVYGEALWINATGIEIGRYPTVPPDGGGDLREECILCQPAAFFRRSLFEVLGPLDESLATAMDYEYWMRAFAAFHGRIGYINQVLAFSRLHKECKTLSMRRQVHLDAISVVSRHFKSVPEKYIFNAIDESTNEFCTREDLLKFLFVALRYYDRQQRRVIMDVLRKDKRLLLNNSCVKINIYPDGWTGKSSLLKISKDSDAESVCLKIRHAHPENMPSLLVARQYDETIAEFYLFENEVWDLTIPIVKRYSDTDYEITLDLTPGFVPALAEENSQDWRCLGILILSINVVAVTNPSRLGPFAP